MNPEIKERELVVINRRIKYRKLGLCAASAGCVIALLGLVISCIKQNPLLIIINCFTLFLNISILKANWDILS